MATNDFMNIPSELLEGEPVRVSARGKQAHTLVWSSSNLWSPEWGKAGKSSFAPHESIAKANQLGDEQEQMPSEAFVEAWHHTRQDKINKFTRVVDSVIEDVEAAIEGRKPQEIESPPLAGESEHQCIEECEIARNLLKYAASVLEEWQKAERSGSVLNIGRPSVMRDEILRVYGRMQNGRLKKQ